MLPIHLQVLVVPHADELLSLLAVPAVHAHAVVLHAPFTAHAGLVSEQLSSEPPLDPRQSHVLVVPHAVALLSLLTVPAVHAHAVVLHTPFTAHTGLVSEQLASVPPFTPRQVQFLVVPHAVALLSLLAVPAVHAHAVVLHTPFTAQAALVFEQLAVVPPLIPAQSQFLVVPHELELLSLVAVPAVHIHAVVEQAPFTGHPCVLQVWLVAGCVPVHASVHASLIAGLVVGDA